MGFITNFTLDTSFKVIDESLRILTLGAYSDLSKVLSGFQDVSGAEAIVFAATLFKWLLILGSIFGVVELISKKFEIPLIYKIAATGVILLMVMLFITTPFETYDVIEWRVAPYFAAISCTDKIEYVPTLFSVISMIGKTLSSAKAVFGTLNSFMPSSVRVPSFENGFTTHQADISWVTTILDLLIVALSVYILLRISYTVAGVVGAILFMSAIGVGETTMGVLFTLFVSFLATIFLAKTRFRMFVIYPIATMLILITYILQPSIDILVIILTAVTVILLYPAFYALAYLIYGAGELMEKREKLGMKRKPTKYVEEMAGEWDVTYTAAIMTALFSVVLALYGPSMLGLGTFFTIFFSIVR